MPIDTNIILSGNRPIPAITPIDTPFETAAKANQMFHMINENKLALQKNQDTENLRNAYKAATGADGTLDYNKLTGLVAQGNMGDKLPDIIKGQLENNKLKSEQRKSDLEATGRNAELIGREAQTWADPQSYAASIQRLNAQGIKTDNYPPPEQFNPTVKDIAMNNAMSLKDKVETELAKQEYQVKRETADATQQHYQNSDFNNKAQLEETKTHNTEMEDIQKNQNTMQERKNQAQEKANILKAQQKNRLPPTALKLVIENQQALKVGQNISADVDTLIKNIESGVLDLSWINNNLNDAKNAMNNSDPKSRAYSSYVATIAKMNNDALSLQKGTQTEGDAIRNALALIKDSNDKENVLNRLREIKTYQERGATNRQNDLDTVYHNYGIEDAQDFTATPANSSLTEYPKPATAASYEQDPRWAQMTDQQKQAFLARKQAADGGK